jgi:uncharacterized protein YkwD/uncharacterized membrane protein required for colicin V production
MILVDIIIVLLLIRAAYAGSRRGLIHLIFELTCLLAATAIALTAYSSFGLGIRNWIPMSSALANILAFSVLWIIAEGLLSLSVWVFILSHLKRQFIMQDVNRVGGAVLGMAKALIVLTVGMLLLAGSPLQATIKRSVTDAFIPNLLLNGTGIWQQWVNSSLGRDLGDSLNFYTVPAPVEDDKTTPLGFRTTSVQIDAAGEQAILDLINHERAIKRLPQLTMNVKARQVARDYAKKMLAGGYFSHIDAQGGTAYMRMRAGGVMFDAAGENLALAPTIQLAHQGLMNSAGHRDNILSPYFRTVGVGIIDAGVNGEMVVEDFTD